MSEPTTTDRDDGDPAAALYARYRTRRAARARASALTDGVLAAIAADATARGESGTTAGAGPADDAERSPQALYRRYRATRGTVPTTTVDAIMAALRTDADGRAAAADSTTARSAAAAPAVGGDGARDATRRDASLAGRLFRLPGRALDALGAALRARPDGEPVLGRRALPALALAVATIALVPLLLDRDEPSDVDGARLAVLAPDSLLGAAGSVDGYIDARPAGGTAFAGDALPGVAFRLGQLVTDFGVAGRAEPSAALEGVRGTLRFVAGASGDEGVAAAVERLLAETGSAAPSRAALSASVEPLREALLAAAGEEGGARRFALGQSLEAVALAARLAGDGGDAAPLRDALGTLAGVAGAIDVEALPSRAREALAALVALEGRDELGAREAREVVATTERLALLLG